MRDLPGTGYFDIAAEVKRRAPGLHVHAFSPMEVVNGTARTGLSVEDFLITQGVDPTRISAVGYGEQLPIATNDTAAGRQANRRVELVVLDVGEPIPPPRVALQ